jgi:hypothetical protein
LKVPLEYVALQVLSHKKTVNLRPTNWAGLATLADYGKPYMETMEKLLSTVQKLDSQALDLILAQRDNDLSDHKKSTL